jgi:hypothetical protein
VTSCKDPQFNTKFEMLFKQTARPPTEVPTALRMPFWVVLGNHDYDNGGSAPFKWGVAAFEYYYASYLYSGVTDEPGFEMRDTATNKAAQAACLPAPTGFKPSGNWLMGGAQKRGGDSPRNPDPYRHYSFRHGDAQFVALDTNPIVTECFSDEPGLGNGKGRQTNYESQQQDFVIHALDSATAYWKIGFGHHPYVSDGDHGNAGMYREALPPKDLTPVCKQYVAPTDPTWKTDNTWARGVELKKFIEDNLCKHGLDLYLSGHDHNLQWLSANCGRQVEFIVSGAGAKLTRCSGAPAGVQFCDNHNQVMDAQIIYPSSLTERSKQSPGFVYFSIKGPSMEVSFVDAQDLNLLKSLRADKGRHRQDRQGRRRVQLIGTIRPTARASGDGVGVYGSRFCGGLGCSPLALTIVSGLLCGRRR